jgi:replicative DNA helicase
MGNLLPQSFIDTNFKKEVVSLVASRPHMGKSVFAWCLAANLIRQKQRVLFFSLEMTKEQVLKGLQGLGCNSNDIESLLVIDDTPASTISYMCQLLEKGCYDYVIVDDIHLMSSSCLAKTRQEEMAHIINGFKEMAKERNISAILFTQIKKLTEYSHKKDIKPRLEDLGEYYSDCNFDDVHISFLHREAFYKRSTEDLLEFITYSSNERKIEDIQSLSL